MKIELKSNPALNGFRIVSIQGSGLLKWIWFRLVSGRDLHNFDPFRFTNFRFRRSVQILFHESCQLKKIIYTTTASFVHHRCNDSDSIPQKCIIEIQIHLLIGLSINFPSSKSSKRSFVFRQFTRECYPSFFAFFLRSPSYKT